MQITFNFPDRAYKEDPAFEKYFDAIQQMMNRMAVSHFKYGPMAPNYVGRGADAAAAGRERAWMYDGKGEPSVRKEGNTGNTENLLDSANFFVIEYVYPKHPKAHFLAQSSAQSPGLMFDDPDMVSTAEAERETEAAADAYYRK